MTIHEKHIVETFDYYKQEVIHQDLFDPEIDNDIITKIAVGKTVSELDITREKIYALLK